MKYLGIDWGKKKIGLALSEGILADPFRTLTVKSLEDATSQISQILKKEEIGRIVIGKPESGESLRMVEKAVMKLKEAGIEVVEVEETLSTKKAMEEMIELGLSREDREDDNAFAAASILQEYLDGKK